MFIKNQVLRACFLLLLTGPVLSYADLTVIMCDIDQSAWSGWNDICLPGSSGIFTPGMTDWTFSDGLVANVIGIGSDFASAWEDAEHNCRSMATKLNTKGQGGYALPGNFTCPIDSCEEQSIEDSATYTFYAKCECHKKTGNQCSKVSSPNIEHSGQNIQDLYTKGMRYCAKSAHSAQEIVSVYCGVPS